jgi:hypothetical protein
MQQVPKYRPELQRSSLTPGDSQPDDLQLLPGTELLHPTTLQRAKPARKFFAQVAMLSMLL